MLSPPVWAFIRYLSPRLAKTFEPHHPDLMGLATGGAGMFAIGILNDSLSSGTGLFATLWLLSSHGLDYRRPIAYTLVIGGLFWNSVSALTLGIVAQTKWTWLPALVCGSLIGGYFGALLVITKGNRWIKRGFEIITLIVGAKLTAD